MAKPSFADLMASVAKEQSPYKTPAPLKKKGGDKAELRRKAAVLRMRSPSAPTPPPPPP